MKSFRIVDTKFRILSKGRVGMFASIAVGAMVSFSAPSLHADTTTVLGSGGSSTPGVYDQGSTSGVPAVDGTAGYHSGSFSGLSTVDFIVQTQNIDALGINTTFNYNRTGGTADWSYTTVNDNSITLNAGRNLTGKTLADGGTYAAVYTQNDVYTNVDENNWNYSYFGASSVLNVQGNNNIDGQVGLNFTNWDTSVAAGTQYAAVNDMLGTINLNGYNVTFGNAVFADNTIVYSGTNNTVNNDYTFYGALYSNLTFNQAASVLLNGGLHAYSENYGGTGQSTSGNLDYNGYNSVVTLGANQTIDGDITTSGINGTLIFQGAGTVAGTVGSSNSSLEEVRANGIGNVLFTNSSQQAYVDHVNYQAAALIGFNGGLNLTVDTSDQAVNTVTFNNHDGVLQINNGDLTGIEGQAVVTTTGNNLGTVTMISGTQAIYGDIGSNGHAIKTLNIGGDASGGLAGNVGTSYSTTTAHGDIYATNTVLNNNSTTNNSSLIMATDYDLYSTVTTTDNGAGVLTLAGGVQNVTGNVGTNGMRLDQVNSGANGATSNFGSSGTQTDVYADTVSNTGTGTTNFSRNVTATTINVASGISNFTNNVTATTTNIGSGVANFNTNGTGTTATNIVFSASTSATTSDTGAYTTAALGSATANLMNGLTGNISFAGNDATVNVWDTKAISGAITTATNSNTGTINYRGDGTISSTVGATGMGIKELNINTNNDQSTAAGVTANGDIYAGIVNLKNNATLTLADGVDITGTTTSETNVVSLTGTQQVLAAALDGDGANTGTIKILGTSVITGVVGDAAASIATIEAGANTKTVTFNNMAYVKNLNYTGNGTVILNGQTGVDADTAGMKGTVDFGTNGTSTGTLRIGDNVNITTGINGIQFADANGATLTFNGTSSVHGDVGSLNGTDTFKVINGGVNTETVTFNSNVYFMDSLNLSNDGTINIADGHYARRNTTSATTGAIVTTTTDGLGNLVYEGGTTLYGDIGTAAAMLKSVTFNSVNDEIIENIGHNVYADTVTVGGVNGTTAISLSDVTGVYDYAGATTMKEYRGGTAANITADVTLGGDLVIANDTSAINFGKSHVTVGYKHDGVTAGNFTTNSGAMSFTVNTNDITTNVASSTSTDSALVSVAGNLNMNGDEKIHINYVGSLANSGSYTVVNAAGGTSVDATLNSASVGSYNQNENGNVSDNSFSIDTRVATNASGDLIVYADRTGIASGSTYAANQNYVQKSQTVGHFSNNAAVVLGGIAAAGNQTGDMVQVIQKMDIDSFGYGNNQANLAVQAKRLAPIANASLSQSAIGANTLTLNTVSNRIADLRGDSVILPSAGRTGISAGDESAKNGAWVKLIASTATQEQDGMYDGYKTRSGGLAMGIDHKFSYDITAGLAFGYTRTNVDQKDFRAGDTANTDSYNIVAYASKDFERAYVEGAVSYAHHDTDSTRAAAVGRTAHAEIDANQYTGHLSAGYRFNVKDKATVTPFLALDYTHLAQDAYTETGAGAINLQVDELSTNRTTFGGGLRVGTKIDNASTTLRPELKLAAYHISGGTNTDIAAQYVGGGAKFVTPGTDLNNMMYNVGLGLKAQINEATSLGFTVDYDRSSNGLFEGYTGQLVGRYEF